MGQIVFNCVYAPVVAILRRKRRRTRSVWSLLSGKVLSLSAALCLWEVVHDSGVEDVGHPVAMGVVLALLQLLYIVDVRSMVLRDGCASKQGGDILCAGSVPLRSRCICGCYGLPVAARRTELSVTRSST